MKETLWQTKKQVWAKPACFGRKNGHKRGHL